MQDATEHFLYPELVKDPLRLEVNFSFALESFREVFAMGENMSSVAVDISCVVGKHQLKWKISHLDK